MKLNQLMKTAALVTSLASLSACASWGVQPWERNIHAKPEMALDGDSITVGLDEHIYFSKESSSGGRGFGGGGCGCN